MVICIKKGETMKILFVEDDRSLSEVVTGLLKKNNYSVDAVMDGEDGYDYALADIYDVIILDVMLPGMNGYEVARALRKDGIKTPILMLTAKSEIDDKVDGLDSGADDYLTKPFASKELLARLRALSRRGVDVLESNKRVFGDVGLDMSTLDLECKGKSIKMTLREAELMELLIMRKSMITPKELIIEKLWGYDSDAESNNVEVYVSFLRKKLNHLSCSVSIRTVRGAGYALEVKADV